MRQVRACAGFDLCRLCVMACGVTASLPCKAGRGACLLVLEAAAHRGLLCAAAGCWGPAQLSIIPKALHTLAGRTVAAAVAAAEWASCQTCGA